MHSAKSAFWSTFYWLIHCVWYILFDSSCWFVSWLSHQCCAVLAAGAGRVPVTSTTSSSWQETNLKSRTRDCATVVGSSAVSYRSWLKSISERFVHIFLNKPIARRTSFFAGLYYMYTYFNFGRRTLINIAWKHILFTRWMCKYKNYNCSQPLATSRAGLIHCLRVLLALLVCQLSSAEQFYITRCEKRDCSLNVLL